MAFKLPVYQFSDLSKKVKDIECNNDLFDVAFNPALVKQAEDCYVFNSHIGGIKSTLNRAKVRGGGKKPHRQKGSGKARMGTIRSPIARGGGMIFEFNTEHQKNQKRSLNKKMYKGALLSIISEQIRRGSLKLVDSFELKSHKAKAFVSMMDASKVAKAYMITDQVCEELFLATRNLHAFQLTSLNQINLTKLCRSDCILVDVACLLKLEERYGS